MPAGEAQTPAKYPLYLSAVTSPCVWSEFPSPSTVDVWLGVVAGLPSVVRAQEGFVTCSVESVSVQPADGSFCIGSLIHTLHISARQLSEPGGTQFLQQSPLATLDRYVGHQDDGNAPEWVRRARSSIVFQYQAAPFAKLFTRLATWKVNSDQVDLPLAMVAWARSLQTSYLTTPPNQPVAANTRNHKLDTWCAGVCPEQSPTIARDIRHMGLSEDEWYAEVEAFVPKILDFGCVSFGRGAQSRAFPDFDDLFDY